MTVLLVSVVCASVGLAAQAWLDAVVMKEWGETKNEDVLFALWALPKLLGAIAILTFIYVLLSVAGF